MKSNNLFRYIIIITLLIIIYTNNIFASIDQGLVDVNTKMSYDRIYSEVIMSIINSNVKMTQDNDNYYFEVSQDMVHWASFDGRYILSLSPSFALSDRSDITTLRVNIKEAMNTLERTEKVYFHDYGDGSRDLLSNYQRDYKGNIRANSHSVNYYISGSYLNHNNPNVNTISLVQTGTGNIGETFNLTTKFSVKKDNIAYVRYFSFIFNRVYIKLSSSGAFTSDVKCGVTNYAIDLMQYIDCDHDFDLRECNNEKHIIYCKKCDWLIDGYHNFNIEYDNIENDECICGYRKQIRLTHKNNLNDLAISKFATPNDAIYYDENYDFVKGHTLLYYEDMELKENSWDLATKSIIATMPNTVPINSHIYTAIYRVNSYYIQYSSTNSLNLDFDVSMNPIKLDYGEKYNLDKNLYIKTGYNFIGWSVRPDISKKVFDELEEVESLSDKDGDIVTLHPVFSPYQYTIHYIDDRYGKNYFKQYSYDVNEALDINTNLHNTDRFTGFKINGELKNYNNTADILNYIKKDNDVITLEASYYVDFNEHEIGIKDDIKVISESDVPIYIVNNDLPKVVEKENANLIKENNRNDKNQNKDNKYSDAEYDKDIVDVFLGSNIRLLNQYNINKIIGSDWMIKINEIIFKIKNLLLTNIIIRNLVKVVIIIMIVSILLLLILLIMYNIKENFSNKTQSS